MHTIGSVGVEYETAHREMLKLHDGEALCATAQAILADVPEGPLTFIATSPQGTGLAAVCAALHGEGSSWHHVRLIGRPCVVEHHPVVVEPVDGGTGWRSAVTRKYPDATFALVADAAFARA